MKFKSVPTEGSKGQVVISISKRAGNSPTRNRLKRLIREGLRLSKRLESVEINLAIFVTGPVNEPPQLKDVQHHLERFFSEHHEPN